MNWSRAFLGLAVVGAIALAYGAEGRLAVGAADAPVDKGSAEPARANAHQPKKPAEEQYRVLVAQGEEKGSGGQWFYLDRIVRLGAPFDVRGKNDTAAAKGVLQRTKDGGLHFKGRVSVGYSAGSVDAAVELGRALKAQPPASGGTSSPLFVRFERPKPEGSKNVKVIKRTSGVSEKVVGGKVFSTGDQLLIVPGPRPPEQTPSQWFQSRLKADNHLTADNETWVLFSSEQMGDYDRMSIERIEREGNRFTVTTNRAVYLGPLYRNITYHEVHGINFGDLPAGDYTAKWIIRSSTFNFGKGGRAEDMEDGCWKELSQSFTVRAARKRD